MVGRYVGYNEIMSLKILIIIIPQVLDLFKVNGNLYMEWQLVFFANSLCQNILKYFLQNVNINPDLLVYIYAIILS